MRLPDVIQDLKHLQERMDSLQRDLDFHHAQFRQVCSKLSELALALPAAERAADTKGFERAISNMIAVAGPLGEVKPCAPAVDVV